jgi:hypothetical protein
MKTHLKFCRYPHNAKFEEVSYMISATGEPIEYITILIMWSDKQFLSVEMSQAEARDIAQSLADFGNEGRKKS